MKKRLTSSLLFELDIDEKNGGNLFKKA